MIKVLFICHGNICRSPMAEFVMKDLVKKAHLEDRFEIASAATSTEEIWGAAATRSIRLPARNWGNTASIPAASAPAGPPARTISITTT